MKTKRIKVLDLIKPFSLLVFAATLTACTGETSETTSEATETTTTTTEEAMDDPVVVKEVTAVDLDNDGLYSTFVNTTYYEDYDVNGNKMLDENEFNSSLYKTWDANKDNKLDKAEWNTASKDFSLNQNETWAKWDTNNDGVLSEEEHRAGVSRNNWFKTWDTDRNQGLSEKEYVDGIFVLWDKNKDGKLDSLEYVDVYNRNFNE